MNILDIAKQNSDYTIKIRRYLHKYPEISEKEYNSIIDYSWKIGVRNAFIQEGETQNESFIPNFTTFRE